MSEPINQIAESEHYFDEKALQLAQHFFKLEDTSLLKTGMFGYTTSLMSHLMRDNTFHRNMLYNEFFLTNANLYSTLFNWSKMLDYPLNLGKPAFMPALLRVDINGLLSISDTLLSDNGIRQVRLDRGTRFMVGGYSFVLPYDLVINIVQERNYFGVTALYDIKNKNYAPDNFKVPILKVFTEASGGKHYANIALHLYQLEKEEYIFTILSNDILDSSIIEQEYQGNLASFNVFYAEDEDFYKGFAFVEPIFNELKNPQHPYYVYYTLLGEDTIRLYFDRKPRSFRPKYNSRLKLEIFTTRGEEVNFNYVGNITMNDPRFEEIGYSIVGLSQKVAGGQTEKSFDDNKLALMELLSSRKNYTTTYDLRNFFTNIKNSLSFKYSEFEVCKTRDDMIRRQFSIYTLLRDQKGTVIPTNTVDLILNLTDLEENNYSLKPGTLIVYDRIQNRYRLLENNELPEVYLQDKESFLYCIPYLINFNFHEYPKANTYLTHYGRNIELKYDYYNVESITDIIINNYSVKRNPTNDIDFFTLNLPINGLEKTLDKIKVRCLVEKEGKWIGYVDLERDGGTNNFTIKINTHHSPQ